MITESVISDDGGREGKWVVLFIAMFLLVVGILLPYHQLSSEGHERAVH
ncbi:hypothetical protein [uncultured Photobacterium sp.]|nr:hypothetical protein [uncultured Photobacterium sp.]